MSEDTTSQTPPPDEPRRLKRSSSDRVLGGVCGGLGAYLGVDPIIVRVVAVVLVFFGGAGILFYLAAWLLVPSDGPGGRSAPGRAATVAGVLVLVIGLGTLLPFRGHFGGDFGVGGFFLSVIVIGAAGLVVWRLASGQRATGGGADVVRRAGLGVALIAASVVLAVGGAWAAAAGGATVVAIIVIVAGVALVAGAFAGGAVRWLIVPALALALPAGVVAAAGLDVKGGVGEHVYRPASVVELRDHYRVGVGRLVLDLRDTHLPPGDHHVRVEAGVGQVLVLVPRSVCVSSRAHVGIGEAQAFINDSGGVDVDFQDGHLAPAGTPRLVLDGDVGIGNFQVGENERGHGPFQDTGFVVGTNSNCLAGHDG
jgi:phage shock protein PspC (stress-responsive transcriptional regulator)